jgi:hypothetical protein
MNHIVVNLFGKIIVENHMITALKERLKSVSDAAATNVANRYYK